MTSADPIIAVVDDDQPIRTMLGRLLRLARYQVASFASGEEFLASVALQRPACTVLDVNLSGISGFEVQARLREAQVRIPVVLITASDAVELDASARELGAVCLLRKPFSNDDLLAAIRDALASVHDGT